MIPSDVCPTEDAIQLFLEYLVDPMLPAKSSTRDTVSQSQQQLVAKQVHAVVLLYNYYHRKQHQQLKFEGFESFCKLVVVLRPALLTHMKLMQRSDDLDLNDLEKQLSLTEKTVMDACDITENLDASKDIPGTEGWPISKIAILLVDSRKENCFLQFSSITQGVWSVIEKDVKLSSCISEATMERKHKTKKIKLTKRPMRDESGADDLSFQQIAFSAVKEAVGCNQSDLTIVGSNVVYSLSKEKTAACFYILQSIQPEKDALIQIPIKDVIDSLQGPLVMKKSCQWQATPVVEYFHLLPYARFLSEWFAREVLSSGLQDQRLGSAINLSSSKRTEESYKPEIHNNQVRSDTKIDVVEFLGSSLDTGKKLQQTDKNGCDMNGLSGDSDGPRSMFVDVCPLVCAKNGEKHKKIDTINLSSSKRTDEPYKPEIHDNHVSSDTKVDMVEFLGGSLDTCKKSQQTDKNGCNMNDLSGDSDGPHSMNICSLVCPKNGEKHENIDGTEHLDDHPKMLDPCLKSDSNGTAGIKDEMVADSMRKPLIIESGGENILNQNAGCDTIYSDRRMSTGDCALASNLSNSTDLDKLKSATSSNKNILLQTALRILRRRRDKLTLQQRNLEDEIALCDKRINTLLNGGKGDLILQIESILEGYDDTCQRSLTQERSQHLENQSSPQSIRMKRLSEAVLIKQNSCQELDDISYENNWMLPTYRVSPSDGGFQAWVTVKGMDFEFSSAGNLCSCPREARESAAVQMLSKLRRMASEGK